MNVYLPPPLFATNLLKTDEWIFVKSGNKASYLAKAWPNVNWKTQQDLDCGSLKLASKHVWLPRTPVIQVKSLSDSDDAGVDAVAIIRINPSRAFRVSLRIFAMDTANELEVFGFAFSRAKKVVKRKMIASLINGLVFCRGARIRLLDGALTLEATEADSSSEYHQFTSQTIITIIDIVGDSNELDSSAASQNKDTNYSHFDGTSIPIPTGLESAFHSLHDLVKLPLVYADLVEQLGIEYPKGVLLYGPPGVGKTMLVSTVAKHCDASLFTINGSDVFGSHLGESEERIRSKFNEALDVARSGTKGHACILFIDEIDAIAPNRNESSQSDSRMVATLLTLMDGMKSHSDRLVILAATNRPNAIDPALRRPGRFDREIAIDAPTESARCEILKSMAKGIGFIDSDVDFKALAISTNGYVGADLASLSREAVVHCLEHGNGRSVNHLDFLYALSITTPSTTRGYAVGVPSGLTWDSVGGLEDVKLKLQQCVEWPITRRDTFRRLGLKPPRGVLLYGPPGCSKTTLVKIIACTSNATFLSINGASLYSPFVGDSEQSGLYSSIVNPYHILIPNSSKVRALFQRARVSAPSVIFLDEIDAIVGNRDLSGGVGGARDAIQESVLSTLLNEMDGIEAAKDILVVGATNRPDMIDAALMRPGRFDKVLYVPPPDLPARLQILLLHCKGMPISSTINFQSLAARTERYTGADLESVCREAAFAALRESKETAQNVEERHFEDALKSVKPSLSVEMIQQYSGFSTKFGVGTRK
ncbi:UNVERIFIED_CONTAM: hypothetical protein HDU68_012036 [Siphonaria sp. JEL0065]|nr:hypothetical protein HDU68_012036 [Siphonaria sp. JEL0065]